MFRTAHVQQRIPTYCSSASSPVVVYIQASPTLTESSYTVGPQAYHVTFLPSASSGTNGVLLRVRELYMLSLGRCRAASGVGAGGARHTGCAIRSGRSARLSRLCRLRANFGVGQLVMRCCSVRRSDVVACKVGRDRRERGGVRHRRDRRRMKERGRRGSNK